MEQESQNGTPVNSKVLVKWGFVLAIFILLWIIFNFLTGFLTALTLSVLALRVKCTAPFAVSLALLVACPIFVWFNLPSVANTIADLAYYFLALGVLLLLIEHFRLEQSQSEEPEE